MPVIQCEGIKNNGMRCLRKTEVDDYRQLWYCWQHQDQKYKHAFPDPIDDNYSMDGKMKHLARMVLRYRPELADVRVQAGINNIGFVRAYNKPAGKKAKFADCRKVTGPMRAFIPFKFIITFYDYNVSLLTENQKKVLMYHELRHIDTDGSLIPHDIEDFSDILKKYGLQWAKPGQEVPDILKEGEQND